VPDNRGTHLQEAHVVQEAAQVGDDLGAGDKVLTRLGVDHEVQVALAEACLLVGNAKVLPGIIEITSR
jgi:hypothetical protein